MDEQSLNELLECSVCLERLDHTSKVLQCQHTFCRRCLDEIYSTKRELRCPECRTLVEVPVEELPSNILLIRLLEGLKTKKSERCRSPRRNQEHPSFGDHTSKQSGTSSQPSARALYNYEASEQSDLSFKKGDVILLKRQVDENWYQGESNNQQGFFPASYVKVIVPLPVTIPQCRGLYDFDVEDEEDKKDCLCFKKDEILTVIKRVDSNWIEGKKGDKIGIFPISFVELNDNAKALISSKNSTNSLGGGDLLSPHNTQFLNPASLAGQLPQQKRHSFTAMQDTPTQYQHNRRSLELSSKGNLVIPPTSASGQVRSPPPLPRTGPERSLNVTDQAGGSSREKTSCSRGATQLQENSSMGSSKTKIFVALYHYKPQKEDEVELRKGDYYSVIEACQDGWFKGRCLKTGKAGVFPGNYVQQARSPSAGGAPNNVQNVRAKTSSSNSKSSSRQEMSSRQEQPGSVRQDNSVLHKQVPLTSSRLEGPPSSSRQELSAAPVPTYTSSSSLSSGSQVPPVKSSHKPHSHPPSSASLSTEANPDRILNSQMLSTSHTADHLSSQARSVPKPVYVKASKMSPLRTASSDVQALAANTVVIPPNSVISKTGPVVGGVSGPVSVVPSAQIPDAVGASGESSSSNKREKREKEKISLVKRLTSGKNRKARSTPPDSEGALPSGKVAHTRSGSYPSEVATSVEGQHVKTGSFDSSVHPPHGSKQSKQKSLSREKYRCKEPYPAQHVVELDLMVGDIVYVTKKREDGWFKGTLQRSGKTGLFPGSFVEKVDL
ncbi:E3 ubiquitin-protein ligase SH3RF3-like isoform X2 [Saccostrea echinata]|uniref:E3 ubiquitin-protein ligase SH3RF3-like isoform X2 n=1 Tax=Saccostrea echinata TaxID=191078 RepID=UPI002A8174BA|nr:E3 ubiquitin-protein ligase SH3RF3-like isoform X2 [Saccostrea echinata]